MTKARHPLITLPALLGALVAALALTSAPAVAAPVGFGSPGSSVAVDNSGNPLDPFHGDVYVAVPGRGSEQGFIDGEVDEFNSSGTLLRSIGSVNPTSVAVDESAGLSAGDIYVGNESHVEKFSPTGTLLLTFGSSGTGPGEFSPAYHREGDQSPGQNVATLPLAVDASGDVWVGDRNRIEEFNEEGTYVKEAPVPGVSLLHGLAIDTDPLSPSSGDFYISGSSPVVESQHLFLPRSGSLTLTFEGQTTAPLQFNATQAEFQSALEALSTIGHGNVAVAINEYNLQPGVDINFIGALRDTALPLTSASAGQVEMLTEGAPGGLLKLESDGTRVESIDASGEPRALGVDPATGDLFVVDTPPFGNGAEHTLLEFSASGTELKAFGAGEVAGEGGLPSGNALAFGDAAGALYVTSNRGSQIFTLPPPGPLAKAHSAKATEVGKITATLNATVNPEGKATTYHFQYITEKQFMLDGETFGAGTLATPESSSIGEDFSEDPASAAVTALSFGTTYRFRVVATNTAGIATGETGAFTTLPPLRVDSTSASDVTTTSVTLDAQVNPLGEAATYHFEYITEAAYLENGESFSGPRPAVSVPQPEGALGSGEADAEVSQHVQGLSPSTVYRYRVVGVDAVATTGIAGPALAFTTQGAGGPLVLPDGREWELASPPDKHGAEILPIFDLAAGTQASASGDGIAYVTTAPTEGEPAGNSNFSQVLSTRGGVGASSWRSRDLAIPHNEATQPSTTLEEYRVLSSDLSLSIVQPFGPFNPALSEEASEQTPYLRSDYLHGEPGDLCTASCYRPLVTGAPGFADVPEGIEFAPGNCHSEILCGPEVVGATPDLSHVVVYSRVGLTTTPGDGGGLYEWSAGQLQLISVLPDGEPISGTPVHSLGVGQGAESVNTFRSAGLIRHAISPDGSRVYFSDSALAQALYVRENIGTPQARTVAVPGGAFEDASVDGSLVFVLEAGKLSQFDLRNESLTSLATGVEGVIGASEDGSSVYFVSTGDLTGEAQNGEGAQAQAGQPNLYVSRAGAVTFLATLSPEDAPDWQQPEGERLTATARVSPDGHWLAFMSQLPLTGYDNRDAVSGAPDQEVYIVHVPEVPGEAATLACASCNPTGARPHGVEYTHLEFGSSGGNGLVGGGSSIWHGSQWLAANVPPWTSQYHQPRYLSDSGRLFFNSSDALVPQDTNNTEDVYQYEPPKSEAAPAGDTCATGSATYSPRSGGCVSLISSGTSPEESAFLDASESGGDVFFLTAAKLSSLDVDSAIDVYDAHECSTSSPCPPPPPAPAPACEGDACQSPAAAPEDPTPGSLTYSGPGNLAPALTSPAKKTTTKKTVKCKKPKKLSHGKCLQSKKRAKKAKKSAHINRRASR